MANASGTYKITQANNFKAFDKLPKAVRLALAHSNDDWVAPPIVKLMERLERRGIAPSYVELDLLRTLEAWNAEDKVMHFYRLRRMAETGVDYLAPIRRDAVKRKTEVIQLTGDVITV